LVIQNTSLHMGYVLQNNACAKTEEVTFTSNFFIDVACAIFSCALCCVSELAAVVKGSPEPGLGVVFRDVRAGSQAAT